VKINRSKGEIKRNDTGEGRMKALEDLIIELPFFRGLGAEHIKSLAGCARDIRFEAGETIFREGEEANHFYVIRQGRVALNIQGAHRGPITIQTVEDGEVLGWSWLIPPYKWRFTARVVVTTQAIVLDGRCLRGECEQDYHLGYEVYKRFAHLFSERLDHTIIQLLDLYCESPPKKTKF
jgi:CRP/FNR family cyclic AMP-dependent transcriptional regulator